MPLSRRRFIAATALGAAVGGLGLPVGRAEPVGAESPDYRALALRGYNRRFVAQPLRFEMPGSAEEVRTAVGAAVDEGLRLAARSGGHCFEGFVDDPGNQVVVDLQRMRGVEWDAEHGAVAVGAGATLADLYAGLGQWGVTVPGGICKAVGVGGHITGGGYGPLSRRDGLIVDHLHGVEVVTVDAGGATQLTQAIRGGPNEDLFWAHTGGGGGNFGVVTRFLLRSPDAGTGPGESLPRQPHSMLTTRVTLPVTTQDSFVRFLRNYLDFYARHREPGNPFAGLYAPISVRPTLTGHIEMLVLQAVDGPDARVRLQEFLDIVSAGVLPGPMVEPIVEASYSDTVANTYYPGTETPPRVKTKAAYLRRPYTDDQLRICYRHLVAPVFVGGESDLQFLPLGGAVDAVSPEATAVAARDSFMKMLIHAAWRNPEDDERHVGAARQLYHELYADTGGAPVPGERHGGSYINYPDPDLADPMHNMSGVPWTALYYGDNYPALRRVKARWDPGNLFRHELSIEPG